MIPKEIGKMMEGMGKFSLEGENLKQAEHLWSMLENMSENNPEEYQKFIKKNLSEGFGEMKQKMDKEIDERKVKPCKGFLIKMIGNLDKMEINETENPVYKKLILENSKKGNSVTEEKPEQENNIIKRVVGPLDMERKKLESLEDVSKWATIPFSLSEFTTRKSAINSKIYYYDMTINEAAYKKLEKNPGASKMFTSYFVDCFQGRIKKDKNPLLTKESMMKGNTINFYKIDLNSVKRHAKKAYKNLSHQEPQPVLLEPFADEEFIKKKVKEGENDGAKTKEVLVKEPTLPGGVQEKKDAESLLRGIKVEPEKPKQTASGRPLIEELNTAPQADLSLKPAYKLENKSTSIELEILLPECSGFKEIILDISESELKLKVEGRYELNLKFDQLVQNDKISAKWDKKRKSLNISAPKS